MFWTVLAAAVAQPQPDPYAARPTAPAAALAYDAERGGSAADVRIERWLAAHVNAPAAERAMLAHRLCNDLGVLVGGERRVAACRLAAELTGEEEDKSDLAIAEAFRRERPISANGAATVALARNGVGLRGVAVGANGATSTWLVDTGAEITTVTDSDAARLGVRMLPGAADVGTSTTIRVAGRLGIIDRLTIGSATVTDLPVLVLPDAMLRLDGDRIIPGILGLPVLAAFRRVAWLRRGTLLALGASAIGIGQHASGERRVHWHEDGLGVPFTTLRGTRGAHLDTGATGSALTATGLALLDPAEAAAAVERHVRTGGAGGFVDSSVRVVPRASFMLAGASIRPTSLTVGEGADAATIGGDVLDQLNRLEIDFEHVTIAPTPTGR